MSPVRLLPALLVAVAGATLSTPARAGDKEACASAAEQVQKLRADKKLRAAKEKAIACSRDVCPSFVRNDCLKWLGEVDGALPTVIVRVRDPQNKDIINVKVTVDGEPFAGMLDGTAHAVDPGPHTFRYEAAGMEPVEEQVLVSQGEKDRVLKVVLTPAGAPKDPTPKPPPVVDAPPPPTSGEAATGAKPSALPWVIGGVGVAGLLVFGIFETMGQVDYANMKSGCGLTPQKCAPGDVDAARAKLGVAIAGLAVGAIGIGTAVTMLLLRPSPAKTVAQHVEVAPVAGGFYGAIKTTF